MRADDGAHAARQAVRTVDVGAVVLDADSTGRALLAHMPQPMQLVSQILRAMAPLSVLLQRTRMFW